MYITNHRRTPGRVHDIIIVFDVSTAGPRFDVRKQSKTHTCTHPFQVTQIQKTLFIVYDNLHRLNISTQIFRTYTCRKHIHVSTGPCITVTKFCVCVVI